MFYIKKTKSYKRGNDNLISVNEEFTPYGTKTLDSKDRISLGGRLKGMIGKPFSVDGFMVYVGTDGDILLRPSVTVPSSEAWIYKNPETAARIRKGLKQAGEGKVTRVKSVKSFLDKP
jgi:hypothetical protein